MVGEGISGSPAIGPVTCVNGGAGNVVGVIPNAGPGYVFNRTGQSCYGQQNGQDVVLQTAQPNGPEFLEILRVRLLMSPAACDSLHATTRR